MIDLKLTLIDSEAILALPQLPDKVQESLKAKFEGLIRALETKVEENLSGRVLGTKSGRLRGSLVGGVEQLGQTLVGFVAIEGDEEVVKYGMAHEYGGRGFYEILPVNKRVLVFKSEAGVVFTKRVWHPPAIERSYLRSELKESEESIVAGLGEALDEALR